MSELKQTTNYLNFWRKFATALIDGIILNSGLAFIMAIFTKIVGINLPNFEPGSCEVIFSLVYFATLDTIPQASVGTKLFAVTVNFLRKNPLNFSLIKQ